MHLNCAMSTHPVSVSVTTAASTRLPNRRGPLRPAGTSRRTVHNAKLCTTQLRPAPYAASLLRRGGRRAAPSASRTPAVSPLAVMRAEKVGNAYVLSTRGRRALGIIHFIGGAFVGAAPQLSYGLLMQLMVEKGYTVITTPYKVTFDHQVCAVAMHDTFNDTLSALREAGREEEVPLSSRIFGVGHSNGALLHALIGSIFRVPNRSNIIISYNNKQVSDAIPIPGVLEALRPAATQLQQQLEGEASSAVDTLPLCKGSSRSLVDEYTAVSLDPVAEQVRTVLQEVGSGVDDFTPTPSESRAMVRESYCVPNTLIVQFDNDSIDDSDEIARIISSKYPSGTRLLRLPGTHVTPLGQDFDVRQAKDVPPAYFAALASKAVAQFDIRRLSGRMLSWLGR